MRVALKDHAGEGLAIAYALKDAGHELTSEGPVDLLLVDFDTPRFGFRDLIDIYHARGATVIQYPHGTGPNTAYDTLFEPYWKVSGELTIGDGEKEYYPRLGIDRPTRTIGWTHCTQLPFRPCSEVRKVVFAPTHPNGDGSMLPYRAARNGEIFQRLLDGPWEVTCRFIGESPEMNGLWYDPKVRWVQGSMDLSTAEIDVADAVVAGLGTYPALAIARGVPTVVYGQLEAQHGDRNDEVTPLLRKHLHTDLTRYPLDAEDAPLDGLFHVAATDPSVIADWKRRWIGEPFEPAQAASIIETFVAELRCDVEARAVHADLAEASFRTLP